MAMNSDLAATRYVTAYLDIGRGSGRDTGFYHRGIAAWQRHLPPGSLSVYGAGGECTHPFGYAALVDLLGHRFDALEERRIIQGANRDGFGRPWYSAIGHAKILLMRQVLEQHPDAQSVVWLDAGLPSHSWFGLGSPSPPSCGGEISGFHAVSATWMHNWEGAGCHEVVHWPGAQCAVAGGMLGADRAALESVIARYLEVMDEAMYGCYAHPVEEDIFTMIHCRHPGYIVIHPSFSTFLSEIRS